MVPTSIGRNHMGASQGHNLAILSAWLVGLPDCDAKEEAQRARRVTVAETDTATDGGIRIMGDCPGMWSPRLRVRYIFFSDDTTAKMGIGLCDFDGDIENTKAGNSSIG
jgi:hypothetical protein